MKRLLEAIKKHEEPTHTRGILRRGPLVRWGPATGGLRLASGRASDTDTRYDTSGIGTGIDADLWELVHRRSGQTGT